MATEGPEHYKVGYTLRFPTEKLAELGPVCAAVNLEVRQTTPLGTEVVVAVRMVPEHEGLVSERLAATVRYESPCKVTRSVLVPIYECPEEEIEARKARHARTADRPTPTQSRPTRSDAGRS